MRRTKGKGFLNIFSKVRAGRTEQCSSSQKKRKEKRGRGRVQSHRQEKGIYNFGSSERKRKHSSTEKKEEGGVCGAKIMRVERRERNPSYPIKRGKKKKPKEEESSPLTKGKGDFSAGGEGGGSVLRKMRPGKEPNRLH